ncbi:MAG: DNA polymerase I, partial [Clostridia bacterium]|nr:DNA polymerase I [Clostridia bacterium]
TKDGLPTNGIFGFIKLLFKILDEEQPQYLAVAFDVHAPTFRHKMYDGYKATRKPMPTELAQQVPVLKNLLSAMQICMVELAGYEADDIIGTISRQTEDAEVLIYTGDRDSYQLVRDNVSICFTRRGVSDLDRLTQSNFVEKVGLEPWQIIEEKALMGDSSDNIPGVRGIGGKTALDLLQKYRDLDGVYEHAGELTAALQRKLLEDKEVAYLSRKLATIDTNVPLSLGLKDFALHLPFPAKARTEFSKLEFRTLVGSKYLSQEETSGVPVQTVEDLNTVLPLIGAVQEYAFGMTETACHLYWDSVEYRFPIRTDFLTPGFFLNELKPLFDELFKAGKRAIVPDYKALAHRLDDVGVTVECEVEDVTLLRHLNGLGARAAAEDGYAKDFDLPAQNIAYSIRLAYDAVRKELHGSAEESIYKDLELPLAEVLLDMERTGVRVDMAKFPEFSDKFNKEMQALSQNIYQMAGVDYFNLNSPFQLSDILFEKLGFDSKGIRKNLRGGFSTNADVLEKLAEKHEIAREILKYREIQKLQSTYIDGIRPLVLGGIIHTTYNQTVTATGRLSSSNPNLQNIPVRTEAGKELRKLFIAREGNVLVDADYSQIELRLLAHYSGCKALVDAFHSGEDVHAATAAKVFGVKLNEVTSAMRRRAKTINFGIIYGMSRFGLSKDIGCSAAEAQDYLDKYFATHPEVREFMDGTVERAKKDGYITTVMGRKRYIPELSSSNFNTRSFGERAAMNMPLQGSAAEIIKLAMLRVAARLKEDGYRTKMVLQVHDELVLDTPLEEEERATKMLKEEMEAAFELKVPLVAEVSSGRSWYDAK